jgi:hypothetical protein
MGFTLSSYQCKSDNVEVAVNFTVPLRTVTSSSELWLRLPFQWSVFAGNNTKCSLTRKDDQAQFVVDMITYSPRVSLSLARQSLVVATFEWPCRMI